MPALRVNGIDPVSLGLRLRSLPSFGNLPRRKVITEDPPSSYGGHLVRVDGAGSRPLTIDLTLIKSTLATREVARNKINALFSSGLNRIVVDTDGTPKVIDGVLDGEPTWEFSRAFRVPVGSFRVQLNCANPLWRSLNGTIIAATLGGKFPLPIGTGPSSVLFRVQGQGATATVTVYDAWGNTRVLFTLPSLATTDFAEIDSGRGTIEQVASGVRSNILGTTTISGVAPFTRNLFPFVLDQTWGDYDQSLYPYFSSSVANIDALYTQTWL